MINLDDGRRSAAEEELQGALQSRQAILEQRRRDARALARQRRKSQIRRNRVIAALLAVGLAIGLWSVLGAAGAAPGSRRAPAVPKAVLTAALRSVQQVPGNLAPFPWPAKGQGAVAVLGEGLMAHSAATPVVPIASLTKMMTAYIVLKDHPLAAGAEGPTFTMNAADVAGYVQADQNDDSNIPVVLGEHLTEHQLLEALLIPSADNIANLLATWDAGSIPAFVAEMNATAQSLGMHATHYADASGVNPGSRSDASDQALLAADLMSSPVVRGIVSKASLPFRVAGTIWNYNPALGTDGIIGVKSGFTSAAQGCLVTAAYRAAAGKHVLVIAVALGQARGLGQAAQVDEGLLGTAGRSLKGYRPTLPEGEVASIVSGSTSTPLYVNGPAPLVVGWPGLRIVERVVAQPGVPSTAGSTANTVLAHLVLSTSAGVLGSLPLSGATASSPTGSSIAPTSTTATAIASG